MLKIICICLVLSVVFGVCGCSKINNKTSNENNSSTNISIIESSNSKNNNTSDIPEPISKINPKYKSSSAVNKNSSIDIYHLPTPETKKAPDLLSKEEVYNTIVDLFEVDLSNKIKITSGAINYTYSSYYFSWPSDSIDDFPTIAISRVFISMNSHDFNNLLNQLKKTWQRGRIDRIPHTPYDYEYKKTYTLQKKYQNIVIAEQEQTKTIYVNKVSDNEYIAELNGIFYDPKFQSGTIEIQEDGTGKAWDINTGTGS